MKSTAPPPMLCSNMLTNEARPEKSASGFFVSICFTRTLPPPAKLSRIYPYSIRDSTSPRAACRITCKPISKP